MGKNQFFSGGTKRVDVDDEEHVLGVARSRHFIFMMMPVTMMPMMMKFITLFQEI